MYKKVYLFMHKKSEPVMHKKVDSLCISMLHLLCISTLPPNGFINGLVFFNTASDGLKMCKNVFAAILALKICLILEKSKTG